MRKRGEPTDADDNPFKPMSLPKGAKKRQPRAKASVPPAPEASPLPLEDVPGIDARLPAILRQAGYGDLWPSQRDAAPLAVAGENVVLAVPTASGKSLVAYLALLTKALGGAKGLYIVPLRALASEKFDDLRTLGGALGLRVALAIGDLDEEDPQLSRYDIVVATSEKADALLRHRARWLTDMGCIVADEVHLMGDAGRGPTLEVLLARFRQLNPAAQVVALSATIANSQELADWLGAHHIKTQWRPVDLREGILYGKGIQYLDNTIVQVKSDAVEPSLALTEDSVRTGGSVIVFVNTRKSTEALAEKLAKTVKSHLSEESARLLAEAAGTLKGRGDETSVEKRLARCIVGGAAFHHAGLRNTERSLVERLFKAGHLKALSATPTLAAGVNLPARRVIVRDLFRFDINHGNVPIPVLEYKQMAGRAGRPRYDKVGEAITIAKTSEQRSQILLEFVLADPEKVTSQLANESALRTHVLSSIATGFVHDEKSLQAFIDSTFLAHGADTWVLTERLTRVIDFLLENDLVLATGDDFRATRFGKRVSQLYVDPMSAVKLREALTRVPKVGRLTAMSFLHAVCATPDMMNLYLRRADDWLDGEAMEREPEFLLPHKGGTDYDFFLQQLKTASLLHDWIEEVDEETILKRFGAYPGDVANKVDSARWLLYAMEEIARIFEKGATKAVSEVGARVVHGARAELLPLLELKGVGRQRARALHKAGFTTKTRLRAAGVVELARVPGIGPVLAHGIHKQLGVDVEAAPRPDALPEEAAPESREPQRSLGDFGGD